ncbi:hypothetical protein [Streptomyces sp. NPDC006610]|uniref:hypothetical protein n=1 Tax=Streptomyces sp. NPDC006610 TaxID=3154584 RepID=UPI0033A5F1A3
MPDRSLRLLTFPPLTAPGRERSGVLLRERPASPPDAPGGRRGGEGQEDNPFAPPPEGAPDRPWQPRRPEGDDSQGGDGEGRRPRWGSQWSDRQPGRSSGGFGERPGGAPDGQGGGPAPGPRWDPKDPAQRRARYALLSGMWAFFFALFSWSYVALLLGALALYWGVSALRTKPRTPDPDAPAAPATPAAPAAQAARPQRTAATTGLVTASLALAVVAASFGLRLAYDDYYTCTSDALTGQAREACVEHLPEDMPEYLKEMMGATEG